MKVYLTSAYEKRDSPLQTAKRLAKLDKHRIHQVVDNPDTADLILFVEQIQFSDDYYCTQIRKHLLVKKYPTKTLVHNQHPKPFYVIPGLYVSPNPKNSDLRKQRPTTYVEEVNEYIDDSIINITPDTLYSFVGSRTALVRQKLLNTTHPLGIVKDTTGFSVFRPGGPEATPEIIKKRKQEYVEILGRSKFILCPRGIATSTYRLYETMKIQRVPVILSDSWVPPEGPNWEEFAVFIPEKDVLRIAEILQELEPTWETRAKRARQAWEEFFAEDVRFHYFIEQCKRLLEDAKGDPTFFKQKITWQEIYIRTRRSKMGIVLGNIIKPIIVKLHQLK